MPRRSLLFPVLVVTLLAACGGGDSRPQAESVTRDSAGVQIVESPAPGWEPAAAWRLGDAPLLDLGGLEGPEETQFFRVSAGARLSDGSIVLGSFGSHDLRRFTAGGEHVWTAGREGEGPGEFVGLTEVAVGPGDTLITYDFRQRRFSRFAPDGSFVDSRPLEGPSESGFGFVESLMADGSAVFTWREFDRDQGPPSAGEISRDTIDIHLIHPAGEESIELGTFPGAETVVLESGQSDGGFMIAIGPTPFGRSTQVAGGSSGVWLGDTDRFEIRGYGADGSLRTIARRAWDPVVVDDALVQRAIDEELEDADDDDQRRFVRRRWESAPTPGTLPAFEAIQVDRLGNVWVQQFEVPGRPERTWSVFSGTGRWLGDVDLPDRFSPLEIGSDYVLGRYGDELDVEHIQLWELVKPAG